MRIIRTADILGAAREHVGFGWVENWEGASSLEMDDLLEGAGISSDISSPVGGELSGTAKPATVAPTFTKPRQFMVGGKR